MSFSLAPPPLDIGDLDGFSKSDIFEAEPAGERLANIVGDLEGHSVIVLDGPWGSGKSVFAKQWAGLLRQRGHPVVYFDAFEHDHLDDPFFALFGELLCASSRHGAKLDELKASLVEKALPIVRAIPGVAADVALRSLTSGMISLSDILPSSDAAEVDRVKEVEVTIRNRLEQVATHVACVKEFREALGSAVSKLTCESEIAIEPNKAPLVFIVDELDRCRLSYALRLLERIKHIFAADGVCFVLVTHLKGLEAMVRREYGLDEAARYLDKFCQLRFDIERILTRGPRAPHLRYLDHLGQTMGLSRDDVELVSIIINNLVRIYGPTFRSQERIMLNLALFHRAKREAGRRMRSEVEEGRLVLAAGLCVMRHVKPELYRDTAEGRLDFQRAQTFLRFELWTELKDTTKRIEWYWKYASVDGLQQLTDDERARWGERELRTWQQHMTEVCAEMDQLWQ